MIEVPPQHFCGPSLQTVSPAQQLTPSNVIRIARCLIQFDHEDPFDPSRAYDDAIAHNASQPSDADAWWMKPRREHQIANRKKARAERQAAEQIQNENATDKPHLDDLDFHQAASCTVMAFASTCRAFRVCGTPVCVGAVHRPVICRLLARVGHIFHPIEGSPKSDEVLETLVATAAATLTSLSCCALAKPQVTPACITDITALAQCNALTFLDLGYNCGLSDVSALAQCTELHTLVLDGCIRVTDISPLAHCTALQTLNAMFCGIADVAPLVGCPCLHSLDLYGCDMISDITALSQSDTLQIIKLFQCDQILDVSPLAQCPVLHTLDLGACTSICDVAALADCPCLQTLNLGGCVAIIDVSELCLSSTINTLRLDRCINITDISALAQCPALQILSLCGCTAITDVSPLANAAVLLSLDLGDTLVQSRGVAALVQSASLRTLDLTGVDVVLDLTTWHNIEIIGLESEEVVLVCDERDDDDSNKYGELMHNTPLRDTPLRTAYRNSSTGPCIESATLTQANVRAQWSPAAKRATLNKTLYQTLPKPILQDNASKKWSLL